VYSGRKEESELSAEDVGWLVARLEDAWEDRLSVDVYLWRKDRFHEHRSSLLMRCLVCTAFSRHSVCPSLHLSVNICLCVLACMHTYVCVSVSVHVKDMAYA